MHCGHMLDEAFMMMMRTIMLMMITMIITGRLIILTMMMKVFCIVITWWFRLFSGKTSQDSAQQKDLFTKAETVNLNFQILTKTP